MKNKASDTSGCNEYDYLKSVSSQDCTGLIPAAPAGNDEIENYEELYPFLPKIVTPKDSAKASQGE